MGRGRRSLKASPILNDVSGGAPPWVESGSQPGEALNPLKLSLSLLEKYLIRKDWKVNDHFDRASGRVIVSAFREGSNAILEYPKPVYHYKGQDREADLALAMIRLSDLEQVELDVLARGILEEPLISPAGFSCTICGQCCERMRDAYQGLVSWEEVENWRSRGLNQILNLVSIEEREEYILYAAWKNPKTGRYLKRCPWLTLFDGRRYCRIHVYKPLKCRVYPLSRLHGEYTGCRGFEQVVDAT